MANSFLVKIKKLPTPYLSKGREALIHAVPPFFAAFHKENAASLAPMLNVHAADKPTFNFQPVYSEVLLL